MKEIVRVRCPVCGMMPSLKNLEQTEQTKPAKVRIFVQQMGGKLPAVKEEGGIPVKHRRGSAPGKMIYLDITDQSPTQRKHMEEWFDNRISQYQKAKEA